MIIGNGGFFFFFFWNFGLNTGTGGDAEFEQARLVTNTPVWFKLGGSGGFGLGRFGLGLLTLSTTFTATFLILVCMFFFVSVPNLYFFDKYPTAIPSTLFFSFWRCSVVFCQSIHP